MPGTSNLRILLFRAYEKLDRLRDKKSKQPRIWHYKTEQRPDCFIIEVNGYPPSTQLISSQIVSTDGSALYGRWVDVIVAGEAKGRVYVPHDYADTTGAEPSGLASLRGPMTTPYTKFIFPRREEVNLGAQSVSYGNAGYGHLH